MNHTTYKYSDKTAKIIGSAMKVHSALGNGFQEVIYQRALAFELEIEKVPFNFGEKSLKLNV